ncbi:MAG: hydrogenase iron-sulfur subunit [Planctomycetota bacterium]|nr:MAG: hydrogenase iron-sulfur subunit [Planctomycetota bacterium]
MRAKGVVMMTCQWCIPELAEGSAIPGGGEIFSVACTGSIRPDLIYKAFERGAQGVLIIGCAENRCHFVNGNIIAQKTVDQVREVLKRANVDPRRVRLELPKNPKPERLWRLVDEVRSVVAELGPLKITPLPKEPEDKEKRTLSEIVQTFGGSACLDCGKCSALCTIAQQDDTYSPRLMVHQAMLEPREVTLGSHLLWQCRTCGRCSERCPQGVFFPRIIRALREVAFTEGHAPQVLHGGVFRFLATLAVSPVFQHTWTDWLPEDVELDPGSDVALYPGCLPFYDAIFSEDLNVKPMESAIGAIRILNLMGIKPRLVDDIGCCGHDLYWTGQAAAFAKVAQVNTDKLEASGIKTLVTVCPECTATFDLFYPRVYEGGTGAVEVVHLLKFMDDRSRQLRFHRRRHRVHKVTYHDPCRLVRHLGIVDEPRRLLERIPQVDFREMPYSGRLAYCCGTAGWTGCDAISKKTQLGRLRYAKEIGAEVMLTACPKCFLHFSCARSDMPAESEPVRLRNIFSFLAASLLPTGNGNRQADKAEVIK